MTDSSLALRPGLDDQAVIQILSQYLSPIIARSVMASARRRCGIDHASLDEADPFKLFQSLQAGLAVFIGDLHHRERCEEKLSALLSVPAGMERPSSTVPPPPVGRSSNLRAKPAPMAVEAQHIPIESEDDIVPARVAVRGLCVTLGFSRATQVRVCTVVSELTRNIVQYAGRGELRFRRLADPPGIELVARDDGPGIADVEAILSGRYRSRTGLGKGLSGTRAVMDEFRLDSDPDGGTTVTVRKYVR